MSGFTNNLILGLYIINAVLIVIVCITLFYMRKLKKQYKESMMQFGNGEDISIKLKEYINDIAIVKQDNNEIKKYCEKIDNNMNLCIQKVGIVRYNAFKDVGSNLSFALAILDNNNDGIVLNGIYLQESSNIYAKPIKGGESEYKLSDEEKRAINIAIQKKNFIEKYK